MYSVSKTLRDRFVTSLKACWVLHNELAVMDSSSTLNLLGHTPEQEQEQILYPKLEQL